MSNNNLRIHFITFFVLCVCLQKGFNHDMGVVETYDENWPKSASPWLHPVPSGMYKLLMWINKEYHNPPVIITENGVSDNNGVNDHERVNYFNSYLSAVLDAMEDGCKIKGYFAWSLMDSYEWRAGYTESFGLYHVDFKSPEKKRTPKLSAKVYSNIVKTHSIDWNYQPEPNVIASRQLYDDSMNSSPVAISSPLAILCAVFVQYSVYLVLRN